MNCTTRKILSGWSSLQLFDVTLTPYLNYAYHIRVGEGEDIPISWSRDDDDDDDEEIISSSFASTIIFYTL